MPTFTVPASHGTFREKNDCHVPAGRPEGGQFCSKGGTVKSNAPNRDSDLPRVKLSPDVAAKLVALTADSTTFNIESALTVAGSAFRQAYSALLSKAPAAKAELERGLAGVMRKLGGETSPYPPTKPGVPLAAVGDIKGARRLIEKTAADYEGDLAQTRDVVRATVAVDTAAEIPKALEAIRQRFDVVHEKARFDKTDASGYRDHLFNVRFSNGLVGEIQVHVKSILKVKEGPGHKLYEQARKPGTSAQAYDRIMGQVASLYKSAWLVATLGGTMVNIGGRFR